MSIIELDNRLLETENIPWDTWFEKMAAFREEKGHCLIPYLYVTEDGYDLWHWAQKQRYDWTWRTITDERFRKLDDMSFIWEQYDDPWEIGMAALMVYHAEHGDCMVPDDYEMKDGYQLGKWVREQRLYDGNFCRDKNSRLRKIGFVWNLREYNWLRAYGALEAYKKAHGDCFVPKEFMTEDGMELGLWVEEQRVNLHYGYLSEERMVKLDELGFAWATGEDSSPVVFITRKDSRGDESDRV